MNTVAFDFARVITLTGAHLLTTTLFVALLAVLAIVGLVTAVTLLDVVFYVIDAVDASVIETAQQASA